MEQLPRYLTFIGGLCLLMASLIGLASVEIFPMSTSLLVVAYIMTNLAAAILTITSSYRRSKILPVLAVITSMLAVITSIILIPLYLILTPFILIGIIGSLLLIKNYKSSEKDFATGNLPRMITLVVSSVLFVVLFPFFSQVLWGAYERIFGFFIIFGYPVIMLIVSLLRNKKLYKADILLIAVFSVYLIFLSSAVTFYLSAY